MIIEYYLLMNDIVKVGPMIMNYVIKSACMMLAKDKIALTFMYQTLCH